ncbi:MAG: anthranilate phosphoribosyltransferase [Deltaproteobacteria bacterium]|nr:anthranilate phosphoribosyltransferase [Deltaproteobacteria bacterium]
MIQEAISKVVGGTNLSEEEMVKVMTQIMTGGASDAQIGSFITALRMKGETIEEITGAARVMREKALHIEAGEGRIVDTCGTGGDSLGSFNISTTAAFIAAGAGIKVAKHGNRSVSSKSGSADVLRSLGINVEAEVSRVEECIQQVGIGFLFAPLLHGAMKYAIGPRREIAIRTIFNILGPLTNPAKADSQVMGVYDENLTDNLANVLAKLGSKHAMVVHGMDGLDEITLTTVTKVSEVKEGNVKTFNFIPEDYNLERCSMEDLKGGDSEANAGITLGILNGEKGPKRDIAIVNAAAAIVAGGGAKDIKEGLTIAAESIDSGAAMEKLEGLKEVSNR